jgi:hypothetical protein
VALQEVEMVGLVLPLLFLELLQLTLAVAAVEMN